MLSGLIAQSKHKRHLTEVDDDQEVENDLFTQDRVPLDSAAIEDDDGGERRIEVASTQRRKKIIDHSMEEGADRTIFVGNLPIDVKKEDMRKIFTSCGAIESVRIRGSISQDQKTLKKVAFMKGQMNDSVQSLIGFVKFKELHAADVAVKKVNGVEFRGRHLRVTLANEKSSYSKQSKNTLFLGNLPLNCSEESVRVALIDFGDVNYVRLIRDRKTSVGKGFGYVDFKDSASIKTALKNDGLVEIDGRKIRIQKYQQEAAKPKASGGGHARRIENKRLKTVNNDKLKNKKPKLNDDQTVFDQNKAKLVQKHARKRPDRFKKIKKQRKSSHKATNK